MVSKVTGSLTIQVLLDRLPINAPGPTSIVGNGRCVWRSWLGGLLKEGAHGKSPKCLDGNLGDFGEFCKGLGLYFIFVRDRF